MEIKNKYQLHRAAWKGESLKGLKEKPELLEQIDQKDHRGHTPLHIAAHFGDIENIKTLLDAGANPASLSTAGWRPIDEATASGSREACKILFIASHEHYRKEVERCSPQWHASFENLSDFELDINWQFSSWVPFLTSFCPNDDCKLRKLSSSLRLDYTLAGFNNFTVLRSNVSFLFTGRGANPPGHLLAVNHDKKTVQDFCAVPPSDSKFDADVEGAIDYMLSHDICSHLGKDPEKPIQYVPQTGWFSSAQKEENVGGYNAKKYDAKDVAFRSLIRSDPHAKKTRIPRSLQSAKRLERYRKLYARYFEVQDNDDENEAKKSEKKKDERDVEVEQTNESGSANDDDDDDGDSKNEDDQDDQDEDFGIKSTDDWKKFGLIWKGENITENERKFKATVWMASDYPLSTPNLLSMLEVYSPTNQAWKQLSTFLSHGLPPGFPVKVEIPLFYVMAATVTFQSYRKHDTKKADEKTDNKKAKKSKKSKKTQDTSFGEHLFLIPQDYTVVNEAYIGSHTREMFKVVKSKGEQGNESEDDLKKPNHSVSSPN